MYLVTPYRHWKRNDKNPQPEHPLQGEPFSRRQQLSSLLRSLHLVTLSLISVIGLAQAEALAQAALVASCTPNVVPYDVVYVRAPRFGDDTNTVWAEVVRPFSMDPGADLRLLHPNCAEEVLFPLPSHQNLVDAPIGSGAVLDPNVSFDGKWVVFAYLHDSPQHRLSNKGADIYRLNLETRVVVRLTSQEFTPNTGNGAQFTNCGQNRRRNCANVGVFNLGPAFVAQEDPSKPAIAFTSTRNNFLPPNRAGNRRALQLFVMDWRGHNVHQIGYLNQSMALHPFQLLNGKLAWTSWENQGMRDGRLFNLWLIAPDGTQWNTLSGFGERVIVHHFMTQMADEDIVTVRYYNQNNNGFGDLLRFPLDPPGPDVLGVNAPGTQMPFERKGQVHLTDWTDKAGALAEDFPAPCGVGRSIMGDAKVGSCDPARRIGKVTHPAAAPNGQLLLVYTPGSANGKGISKKGLNHSFYDGGLYVMPSAKASDGTGRPSDLLKLVNSPAYNEQWPRPVVPYSALFPGHTQPAVWKAIQNSGKDLPANSPFGLVGTSSLIWRDTDPRLAGNRRNGAKSPDPDPFNATHGAWRSQGADAGLYTAHDIFAIRLLGMLPRTDNSAGLKGGGFFNHGKERLRILGELPVRHEGVIDQNGHTDTSFLARIPADVPFTFQTLDRNGMVLNMAQTWHQVRPGEARTDCGGCHAHSKDPLDFRTTVAGQPGFVPPDLAIQTPLLRLAKLNGTPTTTVQGVPQVTMEYQRDIKPILAQRCAGCHLSDTAEGKLNLHTDATTVTCDNQVLPGTYYRLAVDRQTNNCPKFGLGAPTGTPATFQPPQVSRYIRGYQARESLLVWKVFGARLDGRTNATREGDLDYEPAADPVHSKLDSLRGLTWDEKLTIARWVDLGAPVETAAAGGWFEDDLRPTLWVAPTLEQAQAGAVTKVTVGAYDLESGLAANTLSVKLNIAVGGQAAGTNLAAGLSPSNGEVVSVPLPAAVDLVASKAQLSVSIRDGAGHTAEVVRTFGGSTPP